MQLRKRLVRSALLLLMASLAFLGLTAPPASAAMYYGISMGQACRLQGHYSAYLWNAGPYGWFCADLGIGIPPSLNAAGGVDIQNYCSHYFGRGARAVLVANDAYGWRCKA